MAPPSQRPTRYSIAQLRDIATRLRVPLPTGSLVFAILAARRERFVRAVDDMVKG